MKEKINNPSIEVIKTKETGIFTNYIFKAIPLAFDESMSYYETLCGLLSYLKDTVIPTVNNNADAVAELQNLFTTLNNYVDNYFTNLDVQEEINNKLDEMATDGTLYEIIRKYTDPIVNLQDQQITAMQSKINNIDLKVNTVASGSPAKVYETVTQLTEDNPDHSKIYLVTENGNWYYWNISTWVSGGVYQSSGIANNSIIKKMTQFYRINENNLFDKTTVIPNKYIDSTNGELSTPIDQQLYYATDYIEIDSTKKVLMHSYNGNQQYAWYDENKAYISGSKTQSALNLYIPTNAKYLRMTIINSIDNFNINYGGYLFNEPHMILNDEDITIINKDVITKTKNPNCILDLNHINVGYYEGGSISSGLSSINKIVDTTKQYYGISDFIELKHGETLYSDKNFGFRSEYDENYSLLSINYQKTTSFTPSNKNCKYVRILLLTQHHNDLSFKIGSIPTENIPTYLPNIENNTITSEMLSVNIIKEIESLNKYYTLKNKKITFLGDSITYGFNGANPGTRVTNPYPAIIQSLTKCISTNLGINGSTISGTGEKEGGVYQGYQPMNIRITNVNLNQDYLIVFGGTNDYGAGESIKTLGTIEDTTNLSFYGSLDIICKYYYDNFIVNGMKIGFITPIQRTNQNNQNSKGYILKDYVDAIKNVCKKYSIPVLDLFENGTIYPLNETFKNNFLPDGLHPNQNLYNIIAYKIADFILSL